MRLSTLWRLLPLLLLSASAPAWAQSYSAATAITPGFTDISGTGTRVQSAETDFGISVPVYFADAAPGFAFPFYGANRPGVRIASDGFVSFLPTAGATGTNTTAAATATPNDFVAAFWDDLDNDGPATPSVSRERIFYAYDAPNNRFIVQWTNAYVFSVAASDLTFQIHLLSNGNVELHYGTMTSPGTAYSAAVENATGTSATFLFANPTVATGVVSNTSYRFTYVAPTAAPACVATVNTPSTTPGAIQLSFTPTAAVGAAASTYLYDVGTSLANPTDIANGVASPFPFFPLTTAPSTQYYWRVRPSNAVGTATGCTVNTFTTTAGSGLISTFPYTTNFGTGTTVPAGWTNDPVDSGSENWSVTSSSNLTVGGPTTGRGGSGSYAFVSDAATDNDPVNLVTIPFNFTSLAGAPQVLFFYQNGNTGRTPPSDAVDIPILLVDASTDGVNWTALGSFSTLQTNWTQATASLAAYAGQARVWVRFRAREQGSGVDNSIAIDDVQVGLAPTGPATFTLNSTAANLPAGGACIFGAGVGFQTTFTASNTGAGTAVLTEASFSGPGAGSFSFNPAPAFPVTIGSANATSFTVLFAPPAAANGPQNATLTLTYTLDGGAPQTTTIALSGQAGAEGAGFVFRGSLSDAACTNGAALPSGTAFLDIATHTRLTTLSVDDAAAALNLTTALPAFGAIRMFGTDHTTLQVTSNGQVGLGSAPALPGTYYGGQSANGGTRSPVAGLNVVAGPSSDLDMAGTYDAADPGQFTPGVYYGLSDADGDGAADDLVITWYHAYIFGAGVYTATTAPLAQYLTSQVVFIQAAQPNQEDIVEVRFIDGNEPGTNVPYRLNTSAQIASESLENSVATGILEGLQSEAALYRVGAVGQAAAFGAPLYAPGGGSTGVRFQAEVEAVATGQAGWRMLGAPVRNYTVGRLAGVNLVQSVVGQYPSFAADNLYLDYDGTSTPSGYAPAGNVTDALAPGQGALWYLFNQTCDPTGANGPVCVAGSPAATGGTSRSFALPMNLEATGAEPVVTGAFSIPLTTNAAASQGFNLLANPFRDDLDVSTLASWASGGTLISAVPAVWDPNAGSTGSYVNVSGSLSTWQGFFLQSGTATALNVPTNVRNTTGTYIGRTGQLYTNERTATPARVAFALTGTDAATGLETRDVAATLVFSDEAAEDWDVYDATKLSPLSNVFATVGFQGAGHDDAATVKAQESRPLAAGAFDVPLVIDAVGTSPTLTLSWAGLDALPEGWALELRDLVTGETVDLRAQASYTFEATPAAARADAPEALVARTTTAAQAKAADAPRFVLHVEADGVVANEPSVPAVFALAAPAPNPTSSSATVAFDVPEASAVSVTVYDLLGRRVAVLAQGQVAAGRHTARIEAGTFAPGVYVVRMEAGSFSATRRVTVVR